MTRRVEAGTDIAMIGAWDAGRGESPLSKGYGKEYQQTLERDAAARHWYPPENGTPVDQRRAGAEASSSRECRPAAPLASPCEWLGHT